jgi:hypothetical protein
MKNLGDHGEIRELVTTVGDPHSGSALPLSPIRAARGRLTRNVVWS